MYELDGQTLWSLSVGFIFPTLEVLYTARLGSVFFSNSHLAIKFYDHRSLGFLSAITTFSIITALSFSITVFSNVKLGFFSTSIFNVDLVLLLQVLGKPIRVIFDKPIRR